MTTSIYLHKSPPKPYTSSLQLIAGSSINNISGQLYSTQTLTASVTQTQAGAAAINAAAVNVTAANANDAVLLPPGYPGLEIFVANLSANALGVFPSGTDNINGGTASAVLAQDASKNAIYKCVVGPTASAGAKWYRNLSA